MKIPIKHKITFIVIGLSLGIVILELFLRLLGLGYKLLYTPPKNRGAGYKIFCVGESTTFGIGTNNPVLQGYPHQLEVMLNNKFQNLKIQCFFDNTIGLNTSEILARFPSYLKKYQPDLVIFMVGANNWWNLNRSNILLFNKNKFISTLTLKSLVFLDRFRVWELIKWIVYSKGFIKYSSDIIFPHESYDNKEYLKKRLRKVNELLKLTIEEYGLEIFDVFVKIAEHDIRKMIKICIDLRIKIIMCSYPMRPLPLDNLHYIQIKIAREFGIPFVNNALLFSRLPNPNEYLSSDHWHPNERGYKIVAENIYNYILENKLIR